MLVHALVVLTFQNISMVFQQNIFAIWETISKQAITSRSVTESQWAQLNEYCDQKLQEITRLHGEEATGIVKRHGLMTFKICLVLTALRACENEQEVNYAVCTNGDFEIALSLVEKSLDSALEVFEALPQSHSFGLNRKKEFFDNLPESFTRADALEVGKQLNIKMRSVDRYLQQFLAKGFLTQESKGTYQKSKIN